MNYISIDSTKQNSRHILFTKDELSLISSEKLNPQTYRKLMKNPTTKIKRTISKKSPIPPSCFMLIAKHLLVLIQNPLFQLVKILIAKKGVDFVDTLKRAGIPALSKFFIIRFLFSKLPALQKKYQSRAALRKGQLLYPKLHFQPHSFCRSGSLPSG